MLSLPQVNLCFCIVELLYCGHHWVKKGEVSLFERLIHAQKYAIGTSETVLIKEVFFNSLAAIGIYIYT